jgi:hypothetical protein
MLVLCPSPVVLVLVLVLVFGQPLDPQQHAALMAIFDATGCRNSFCQKWPVTADCVAHSRITCSQRSVTRLDMSNMSIPLTGTVPSELNLLTDLKHFEIADNALVGVLPEVPALIFLTTLWFQLNKLSGTIHTTFGLLTSLAFLSFRSNNLVGTLPTEFARLTMLDTFRVDSTNVSGRITPHPSLEQLLVLPA